MQGSSSLLSSWLAFASMKSQLAAALLSRRGCRGRAHVHHGMSIHLCTFPRRNNSLETLDIGTKSKTHPAVPAGRGGRLRALLPRVLLAPGPEDLRLLGHMLVCKSRPSTPKFLGALTGSFFWLHVLVSMQDLFVSACGIFPCWACSISRDAVTESNKALPQSPCP